MKDFFQLPGFPLIDEIEIPEGGRKIIKVNDKEIGIFKIDGKYYALRNECIHQRGPVCTGKITGALVASRESRLPEIKLSWEDEGKVLVCPWHGMEFDIRTG